MEIRTDKEIIERILEKGVEQILPSRENFKELLESGKQIKMYQGFDPTAPTLHIGHTALLHKLEDFRKLGHKVYIVIGDFTARIGDPDKKSTRKPLTKEEVESNMKVYRAQIGKILDIDNKENPVEFRYNSEWLEKLNFADILQLTSKYTVQQLLKREMFQLRLKEDRPIYLHEFMYPVMQGYDCVMLDVDLELGGNDQLFNMLAGRYLMNVLKGKEKYVMTGKLLETQDGTKMGKTTGNMIRMDDTPEDIYGKVMAFSDDMILKGFEILTFSTMPELEEYQKRLESGENPMILKKELALMITSEITTKGEALKAQNFFESVFQNRHQETEIPESIVSKKDIPLNDLLVEIKFASSKAQAKRLVEQGAVKINNEKLSQYNEVLHIDNDQPLTLKVGKNICKITYKA